MRYNRILPAYLGLLAILAGACSKEETIPLPSLAEEHTYTGSTLKLSYCGELMPAKKIEYKPGDGSMSGTLTATGETDLSQLSMIGLSGTAAGPGILPGSPQIEMPVTLSETDDSYTFSGKGKTPLVETYTYSGRLQGDSCMMQVTDVVLADKTLAGTVWMPAPIERDGLGFTSFPFRLVWELNPAAGIDIDLTQLLNQLAALPTIPVYHDTAYSSPAQLYTTAVQTVAFNENGNIFIRYYSSVGGATQLMTTTGNTFQYVLPAPSTMLLYPNPTTLFGRWLVAQSDPGDNPNISFTKRGLQDDKEQLLALLLSLAKQMVPALLELCTTGVPLQYELGQDGTLAVYLNTATILTLLGDVVKMAESNPGVLQYLAQTVGGSEQLASIAEDLQKLLPQLKEILLNTTRLEIGLNFNAYK